MSDGSISQDEIDKLLSGMDIGEESAATVTQTSEGGVSQFRQSAFDTFLANPISSFEKNLSAMTKDETKVKSAKFSEIDREAFMQKLPELVIASTCDFAAGLDGDHIFVMPHEMVSKIVGLINNEEKAEIDDMALSVISEVVGQILGAEINEFDNIGIKGVTHNPPESMNIPKAMIRLPQRKFFCIEYDTKIDGGNFKFWEVITDTTAKKIAEAVNGGPEQTTNEETKSARINQSAQNIANAMHDMAQLSSAQTQQQTQTHDQPQANFSGGMNMDDFGQMNMGFQAQNMQGIGANPTVQPAAFPPLQNMNLPDGKSNIGLIMDVYMELTVELGRTKKTVKEILGMGEGHIISLDKLAGESVDILVNHKPIAKGEVVVIEENFGVRVTEILSPSDRVNSLTK